MANLRIIKRRIKSVGGIRQITRAMEMVSSTKLRNALSRVEHARPYFEGMDAIIADLMASIDTGDEDSILHPLMKPGKKDGNVLIVAIGSDKGLCGSFNSNILKKVNLFIEPEFKKETTFRFTPSGGEIEITLTKPDNQTVNFRGRVDSKGVVHPSDRDDLPLVKVGAYKAEYQYKPPDGPPLSGVLEFSLSMDSSGTTLTHFWSYIPRIKLPYSGTLKLGKVLTDLNITSKVIYILPVGKKLAERILKLKDPRIRLLASELNFDQSMPLSELNRITDRITSPYILEEVSEVYIFYTQYISAAKQKPIVEQFLPLKGTDTEKQDSQKANKDYIFSPSAGDLFKSLIPAYARNKIFQALAHSFTSEHSIRMIAMRNATDNAGELIDALTLQRNKARQAVITKELSEIVGGAEALKG
jgi:F0F1-type ATP synthase gamma subunit